jgi:hypothetical protein
VSGDLPENGPGFWSLFKKDADLVKKQLAGNAFRMGIEWSRIFPTSTAGVSTASGIDASTLAALDAIADQTAVAHYRRDTIRSLKIVGEARIPLNSGTRTRFVAFCDALGKFVASSSVIQISRSRHVRLHSACLTGDVFAPLAVRR